MLEAELAVRERDGAVVDEIRGVPGGKQVLGEGAAGAEVHARSGGRQGRHQQDGNRAPAPFGVEVPVDRPLRSLVDDRGRGALVVVADPPADEHVESVRRGLAERGGVGNPHGRSLGKAWFSAPLREPLRRSAP